MLLLATLGLVCTGVLWLGAPSIASWMNLTGDVHDMAVIYLRGRSLELLFLAVYCGCLMATLQGIYRK